MDRKEQAKKLMEEIGKVNPERIESYLKMYDRLLLYALAANLAPKEALMEMLKNCEMLVKKGIDVESQYRTNFLESTPEGRLATLQNEPDGESTRLESLKTWNLAKEIITANLESFRMPQDEDGFEYNDEI